eukprot:3963755-Karenia_brevis.AAC.1
MSVTVAAAVAVAVVLVLFLVLLTSPTGESLDAGVPPRPEPRKYRAKREFRRRSRLGHRGQDRQRAD